jgi:hypothetical protein
VKLLHAFLCAVLVVSHSGCGYALRTSKSSSALSKKGIHRIYVRPMANATFRAGVENTVFNAIVRGINGFPGIRAVSYPEEADAVLEGTVSSVGRSVSSVLKSSDLNPKGLGSSNILVATEYVAVLEVGFELKSISREGSTPQSLWKGNFSRTKPFPANNQLWSLGSTSALINESELDRSLGDIAELMGRDLVQSMLEDF